MWLSLFAVRGSGLYGAAFVDYGPGSVLIYHELLVARLVGDGRHPRVRITDIWVDSEESRDGGRSLWAIPKDLADLWLQTTGSRTTFSGVADGQRLADGAFTALPRAALVRLPFATSTTQERSDGTVVVTPFRGSARSLPCRGRWDFAADGPLGFLHGHRPVASFHLRDARLTFG
jgi:acetoacetate decarboxylase